MPENTCFSDDELKAFALGQMDDERGESISTHLEDCAVCEETIAGFDDTADSVLQNVRAAGATPSATEGRSTEILSSALARIANPWSGQDTAESAQPVREWVRDYELLEQLGSGGMGTVYRAVHQKLGREVALKLLPARRLRNRAAIERFEREMQAIGQLDHPSIVRATDAGEVDGTHFLAMDIVDGIDLSKVVKLNGRFACADACEVIRQVALGLHYAHEKGLIHRDVKPSNIMLEADEEVGSQPSARVKLLDLGLALFGSASEAVDELTTVGQLMGTLDYMAPEQADNSHDVTATADVYSLGATLFKLLTGNAPYETSEYRTPLRKMKALATVDAPPLQAVRADVPNELAAIVDRMLLRRPADRFQSAAEVADAIGTFCAGHQLDALTRAAIAKQNEESAAALSLAISQTSFRPGTSVAGASVSTPPPSALAAGDIPPGRRTGKTLLAMSGVPLSIIAAVVIWIQTDRGTLRIECADEGVPITIREIDGGEQKETLSAGENLIQVYSGQHQIILPVEYDHLVVNDGDFTMHRGKDVVASITRASKSHGPVASDTPKPLNRPPFNYATYRLGPGDLLAIHMTGITVRSMTSNLNSPREGRLPPHYGAPFLVDGDGVLSLPHMDIPVAGMTMSEARTEILDRHVNVEKILTQDADVTIAMIERRTKTTEAFLKDYRIRPNDTLGIFVGALFESGQSKPGEPWPVHFPDDTDRPASVGLPVAVDKDGNVSLQIIGKLNLAGKSLSEARAAIVKAYVVDHNVLVADSTGAIAVTAMQQAPSTVASAGGQTADSVGSKFGKPAAGMVESRPRSNQPLFESRTFDEWREKANLERSPAELEKAIQAMTTLAGERVDEAAEAILDIVDRYSCYFHDNTDEASLLAAAIRNLRQLDSAQLVDILTQRLGRPSCSSHEMIVGWLCSTQTRRGPLNLGQPNPLHHSLLKSPEFIDAIADNWTQICDAAGPTMRSDTTWWVGNGPTNGHSFMIRNWQTKKPSAAVLSALKGIVDHQRSLPDEQKFGSRLQAPWGTAALVLAKYEPRPELVDSFLCDLRQSLLGFGISVRLPDGKTSPTMGNTWVGWKGLTLLNRKTDIPINKVSAILKTVIEKEPPGDAAQTVVLTTDPAVKQIIPIGYEIDRRTLACDMLGVLKFDTPEIRTLLAKQIKAILGSDLANDGEYSLQAGKIFSLNEAFVPPVKSTPQFAQNRFGGDTDGVMKLLQRRDVHLNTCLWAWQQITGEPARFRRLPSLAPFQADDGPYTPLAPIVATFKGKPITEWTQVDALDKDSLEDLEVRLQAISLASDGDTARVKVVSHVLQRTDFSEEHKRLMRLLLAESEPNTELDAALARALTNASPEQKKILLSDVLARWKKIEQFVNVSGNDGSNQRQTRNSTQLSLIESEYSNIPGPKTDAVIEKLIRQFQSQPKSLQSALMTFLQGNYENEASFLRRQKMISAGKKAPLFPTRPLLSTAETLLVKLCNDKSSSYRLKSAMILSRTLPDNPGIQSVVQAALLDAVRSPDWTAETLNAALHLPYAFVNGLPLDVAKEFVGIIQSDFKGTKAKCFQIVIPAISSFQQFDFSSDSLSLTQITTSRRAILTYTLEMCPPSLQKDCEAIALDLSNVRLVREFDGELAVLLSGTTVFDGEYAADKKKLEAIAASMRIDDMSTVDQRVAESDFVQGARTSAMRSMLGKNWPIVLKNLRQPNAADKAK